MATNNQLQTGTTPLPPNQGGTGVTTSTGTTNVVLSNSPVLVTPTLGAASATSIAFSSTSEIIGTTTNNNAAAGSVGELISSVILSASAVSVTTATPLNITTISLTAGDWDVYGNVYFGCTGVTNVTFWCWASLTSATVPDLVLATVVRSQLSTVTFNESLPIPYFRASLSGTTTIYLSAQSTFSAGTMTGAGAIYARRVR